MSDLTILPNFGRGPAPAKQRAALVEVATDRPYESSGDSAMLVYHGSVA
jgi:hypothetical protein